MTQPPAGQFNPNPYGGPMPYRPQPKPPSPKWPWIAAAAGGGVVILLVILLGLAVGSTGSKDAAADSSARTEPSSREAPDASTSPARTKSRAQTSRARTASVGLNQPVRDGKLEFVVTDVETGLSTVGDNPYLTQEAKGQFVVVSMTVHNVGNRPTSFSPSSQKLTDTKNRTFESDTSAQIALGDTDVAVWDKINPGLTVKVKVVFDMPKNATPAELQLHDSTFSSGATVSLH